MLAALPMHDELIVAIAPMSGAPPPVQTATRDAIPAPAAAEPRLSLSVPARETDHHKLHLSRPGAQTLETIAANTVAGRIAPVFRALAVADEEGARP